MLSFMKKGEGEVNLCAFASICSKYIGKQKQSKTNETKEGAFLSAERVFVSDLKPGGFTNSEDNSKESSPALVKIQRITWNLQGR